MDYIKLEPLKRVDLVAVSGRIDSISNACKLEETINDLAKKGRFNLVLELSGIEYASAVGLKVLVVGLRECRGNGGDLRIVRPSKRMREVLNLSGLESYFSIYDNVASAVKSF